MASVWLISSIWLVSDAKSVMIGSRWSPKQPLLEGPRCTVLSCQHALGEDICVLLSVTSNRRTQIVLLAVLLSARYMPLELCRDQVEGLVCESVFLSVQLMMTLPCLLLCSTSVSIVLCLSFQCIILPLHHMYFISCYIYIEVEI